MAKKQKPNGGGEESIAPPLSASQKKWAQWLSKIWLDDDLRKQFRDNPKKFLIANKIFTENELKGIHVTLIEDSPSTLHVVLPATPPKELTQSDIEGLAAANEEQFSQLRARRETGLLGSVCIP